MYPGDSSAGETVWESRMLPDIYKNPRCKNGTGIFVSIMDSHTLRSLKPGSLILVHTQSLGKFVGRYQSSTTDSLLITNDMGESGVPIAAIDAIWVRGRATWKGAKIGGIVGGAAGTILGILVAVDCAKGVVSVGGGSGGCPLAIPVLGVVGAAAGGLVGAGLGTAFPKWHRRYRSPNYDPGLYSNLSEAEYVANWDGGVEYSDDVSETVHPNRLRISIVPDISRGGVNVSASFAF